MGAHEPSADNIKFLHNSTKEIEGIHLTFNKSTKIGTPLCKGYLLKAHGWISDFPWVW